jgi:hypothetical protein
VILKRAAAGETVTMATVGRAYVVRDAGAGTGPGEVYQVYPDTLKGLIQALEDARFRSYAGQPQVLAVIAEGHSTVIRRFEHGREVPVTPLPPERAAGLRFPGCAGRR